MVVARTSLWILLGALAPFLVGCAALSKPVPAPAAALAPVAVPASASAMIPDAVAQESEERSWRREGNPRTYFNDTDEQLGYTGFGIHWVSPDGDAKDRLQDGLGLSMTIGYLLTQRPIALAAEVGGYFSWHNAEKPLRAVSNDFFMSRALVGGRALWTGLSDAVVPYARGGWVYRYDNGDGSLEDGGTGYYLGGGLDFTLGPGLSIAPQVLYTRTDVFDLDNTEEMFYGLEFHLNY